MQTFAAFIGELPAAERYAIREAVPTDIWADIERTNPLGWLPAATNLMCTHAVAARLGTRGTHEFFANLMLSSFDTTLMRGLVTAVVRIAGRDLSQYLNWVSKGFGLLYRDCGDWAVIERGEGSASLEVRGLPPDFAKDRVWLESTASALGALFTLVGVQGAVVLRETDLAAGRAVYRLRWSRLSGSP
jgi:hypothetical protein